MRHGKYDLPLDNSDSTFSTGQSAMSASRPETFDKLFYGFSKGDFRASSASKYFASSYWVLVFQQR
jgi:hypothetical protein|uniref:Uncharacterized protein n=1 Tax=Yersinia enterocolitica TaxID=630 RepID=B0RL50_YEREN|nr:hypothetical protein [Yersinia enterocolitica]